MKLLSLLVYTSVAACALLSWVFVWRYSRLTWRDTPEGQHLLRISVLMGLVFSLTLLFSVIPIPGFAGAIVSFIMFALIAVELWHRLVLLERAQREGE